jgi:hypothetical protein
MNSIDFLVQTTMDADRREKYELYVQGKNRQLEYYGVLVPDDERMAEEFRRERMHGRIVECHFDANYPTHWHFMRFRDDKNTPNFIDVAQKIMQSIQNGVPEDRVRLQNNMLIYRVLFVAQG